MSTRIPAATHIEIRRAMLFASVLTVVLALMSARAECAEPHATQTHPVGQGAAAEEGQPPVSRTILNYVVPPIVLTRADGKQVTLSDELNDNRPVVLNFIYTTCPGICPLASHVFSELQHVLGTRRDQVHLVSISVDPEEDTPARLRAYAKRFGAGPGWQHYTGTVAASLAAQRAFDAYKGDKMGHTPLTLVRPVAGGPWVRFDGFATADMLMNELQPGSQLPAVATAASR